MPITMTMEARLFPVEGCTFDVTMADARRKKSYLLDPRFQLKWTAYLVAVVVIVMVGLGVVIAQTANRAADGAKPARSAGPPCDAMPSAI